MLAEYCSRKGISAVISVVSKYGKELLEETVWVRIRDGAMNEKEIVQYIRQHEISLVVDATHPYAREATENIKNACAKTGTKRIRCLRKGGSYPLEGIIRAATVEEAILYLEKQRGNILVTTGSKEVSCFTKLSNFKERVFVRVLPSASVVRTCEEAGFTGRRLICMQGPFSEEMNAAMIRAVDAAFLVTKEAGEAGGFEEKIQAAKACKIPVVVIGRPAKEEGISFEETCLAIEELYRERNIVLAGIGPGALGQMTLDVKQSVLESDAVFGASRVLAAVDELPSGKKLYRIALYQPDEVLHWLERHPSCRKPVVLFSGDTGFYSGARKMAELLTKKKYSFQILPGISSVAYFASRLGVSWEDGILQTAHGRTFYPAEMLKKGIKKIFLLTDSQNSPGMLCQGLCREGFGSSRISVGVYLSYPEERIVTGTAEQLKDMEAVSLAIMLIEAGEK